mgnify:FL=1
MLLDLFDDGCGSGCLKIFLIALAIFVGAAVIVGLFLK